LIGLHAQFDKARAMLMRVSAQLQGWAAQAAEQSNPVTVWPGIDASEPCRIALLGYFYNIFGRLFVII
jgi:hypothetical protein